MEGSGRDSTFLFADLAGFTALTEAHGDEHAAALAAEFRDLVAELLPHDSQEVKTIGDAVMIRGADAANSVELGLRVSEAVLARDEFPVVRVGMHTGPAIERGGDWFGTTVNVAARVSGAAAGGEVLLTEATRRAAGELGGIELRRHGEHRFKNIREPVAVFQAVRRGADPDAPHIDPVCRMAIAPHQAAGRLTHGGREYYFCSLDCVAAFAADPEAYAGAETP